MQTALCGGGIEVYSIESIENNVPYLKFQNFSIYGEYARLKQIKQSSDGRFYGICNLNTKCVVIMNNFIQDKSLKILKILNATDMGVSSLVTSFLDIIKEEEEIYYILGEKETPVQGGPGNNLQYYLIKLDMQKYRKTEITYSKIITSNYFPETPQTSTTVTYLDKLNMWDNNLIMTRLMVSTYTGDFSNVQYLTEFHRLIIDSGSSLGSNLNTELIDYDPLTSPTLMKYMNNGYEATLFLKNGQNASFRVYMVSGENVYQETLPVTIPSGDLDYRATRVGNYIIYEDSQNFKIFFWDRKTNHTSLKEFYSSGYLGIGNINLLELKQFNMDSLIGTLNTARMILFKNIYIPDISGQEYLDYNFLVPKYLNIYATNSGESSLIYSRNCVNTFVSGNQLTANFIVPNILLNDGEIKRTEIYGTTNYELYQSIEDIEKNQFESLNINYNCNINIVDNTEGKNIISNNISNVLAQTIFSGDYWNKNSPGIFGKIKIYYKNGTTEWKNINSNNITLNGTTATITYTVSGEILKIEYTSYGYEDIVFAEFNVDLSGTNTITQTITIV